ANSTAYLAGRGSRAWWRVGVLAASGLARTYLGARLAGAGGLIGAAVAHSTTGQLLRLPFSTAERTADGSGRWGLGCSREGGLMSNHAAFRSSCASWW